MTLDLKAQVYANPADWTGWLALAKWLDAQADLRGEMVLLEHRLRIEGEPEAAGTREWVRLLAESWVEEWRSRLSKDDQTWIDFWMRVAPSLRALTGAPTTLVEVLSVSASQLLAMLETEPNPTVDAPSLLSLTCAKLIDALIAWITHAFQGVKVPDKGHKTLYQANAWDDYEWCDRSRDHTGCWSTLPEQQLLDNEWALPHLDEQGIHYYLPALMCFHLRHFLQGHPADGMLTESLGYTLEPTSLKLRDHQKERFSRLNEEQRRTIYAFTLCTSQEEWPRDYPFILFSNNDTADAWRRAIDGDSGGWFERFFPPTTEG